MPLHLGKPHEILIGIWEIGLVSVIVWRVVRAIRKSRSAGSEARAQDAFFRIRAAARSALPFRRVADAIGYEIAVTAYALFGADRKLTLPGRSFSYHRKNGYGAVVSGLMIAMIAETAGVHILLVHFHHPRIALLLTVLSLYGALWFLGDYQAARRRPIRIETDHLAIRTGLRWNLDVPFESIAKIERADPLKPFEKGRGAIRATLFGAPLFVLHLKKPLVADGPYGRRAQVERVGFTVDEDVEFLAAMPGEAPSPTRNSSRGQGIFAHSTDQAGDDHAEAAAESPSHEDRRAKPRNNSTTISTERSVIRSIGAPRGTEASHTRSSARICACHAASISAIVA